MDFETAGEDLATSLERIAAYIDNHVPIRLRSDYTDAAKVFCLSNATHGQIWAYHAKVSSSAWTTYERTTQALLTSIPDEAELEEVRAMNRWKKRESH